VGGGNLRPKAKNGERFLGRGPQLEVLGSVKNYFNGYVQLWVALFINYQYSLHSFAEYWAVSCKY